MPTPKPMKDFWIRPQGGIDEARAVTNVDIEMMLEMHNFRVSEGGDRIEKRDGSAQVVAGSTFSSKDIYCYHTYKDSSANFCQLAITEDKIWRKTGAGSWTSIHTWSSSITHPVKVHDIQGKQIIITDVENKMILPGGTLVQLGITAPTDPGVCYVVCGESVLAEDMAVITDWADADGGSGASSQATFQTKSCMRLQGTASSGDFAKRTRTLTGTFPERRFKVTFSIYFDTFKHASKETLSILVSTKEIYFKLYSDGYKWWTEYEGTTIEMANSVAEDTWYDVTCWVDASNPRDAKVLFKIDGTYYGYFPCYNDMGTPGYLEIKATGDYVASDVYIDYFNIDNSASADKPGNLYRYAWAYGRSGNYGNRSNPIKTVIKSPTFYGSGLDDLTMDGTYTGSKAIALKIEIDATGTPDTIKVSYDGGYTWSHEGLRINSTVYLYYGIELDWNATTGHTLADYWIVNCYPLALNQAADEQVKFDSVPASGDSQVDERWLHRTTADGASFYDLARISDNTATTFYDIPRDDAVLGDDMEEDWDIAPTGKYSEWFDQRMWITDEDNNLINYSKYNNPEAYNISGSGARYVSTRRGEGHDTITNIIDYKGHLYVTKKKSILRIRKTISDLYAPYLITTAFGNIAPWSLMEVYGLLMFLSYRGWEVFNGESAYPIEFSRRIKRTLASVDRSNADYITSVHSSNKSEAWLYIPDRTGGASAIAVCLNYIYNRFFTFSWHKTVSSLNEIEDSSGDPQVCYGTRDGFIFTSDSGDQDGSTNISAYARPPWRTFDQRSNIRKVFTEHECLTGKNLTIDYFVDFNKTAKSGSRTHAGATPSATDQELRRPNMAFHELDILGKYFCLEYSNAEQIGSDLKIHWSRVFYEERPEGGAIAPD